jgi:hypothetical protein
VWLNGLRVRLGDLTGYFSAVQENSVTAERGPAMNRAAGERTIGRGCDDCRPNYISVRMAFNH